MKSLLLLLLIPCNLYYCTSIVCLKEIARKTALFLLREHSADRQLTVFHLPAGVSELQNCYRKAYNCAGQGLLKFCQNEIILMNMERWQQSSIYESVMPTCQQPQMIINGLLIRLSDRLCPSCVVVLVR